MSVLTETLGETPLIKTIDFFLTFQSFDYSKSQVAEETRVSRITMDKIWPKLVKSKFLVKTRIVGPAELYKVNKTNPKVKALIDMDFELCSAAAREELLAVKIRH